jgi:hypothetical protein
MSFRTRMTETRPLDPSRAGKAIIATAVMAPTLIVLGLYISFTVTTVGHWTYARFGIGIPPDVYSETRSLMNIGVFLVMYLLFGIGSQILILPAVILNSLTIEYFAAWLRPVWLISLCSGLFFGLLAGAFAARWMLADEAFFGATIVFGGLGALTGLFYCWLTGPR